MWALLIAAALGGVQAKVTPNTGAAETGEVTALSADGLVLKAGAKERRFALGELKAIDFAKEDETAPHEGPILELVDGSLLPGKDFATKDGVATFRRKQAELKTKQQLVRSVLLRSQRNFAKLQEQWRELIDSPRQGDLIVVRRSRAAEGQPVEHSLDQLECIIHSVSPTTVDFTLLGDRRSVALSKVEGVIFYHPQKQELGEPLASVRTRDGGSIAAGKLALEGEKIKLFARAGIEIDVAPENIDSIRFSGGDIVYLSDLEPQSVDWRPYVPTRIGGDRLSKLYAPRMDQAADGGPLRLEPGGDEFEKGLALHSRTELVYRLPGAFKRFQASVGLDPRFRNTGNVEFLIKSETKELFRQAITPEQPRLDVEVDILGARRLTVIVDFGAGWDVGDFVNLCDARLTK